jgi:hypothetical protein
MSSPEQDKLHEVISTNRPDYAALFGSMELCDCEHCRSIYSPAAYLVDLLQFLGPNIPAMTPLDPRITPLDVLIGNSTKTWPDGPDKGKPIVGRRPDIAHIELSCDNTNRTLPYVDLVNEVLESYIAFDQSLPLKTDANGVPVVPSTPAPNESTPGVTAAELGANPENTRDLAYEKLEGAVYPFTLPFNQPMASLRLTLDRMGSSRNEVMSVFRREKGASADNALDVEALKITEHEFAILTAKQFDGTPATRPVSDFYGFEVAVPPADTAWVKDAVPTGALQQLLGGDTWAFAAFAPPPNSGALTHASVAATGLHQHAFDNVGSTATLKVDVEDFLYAEIFIDPADLPQMVMLQFFDGTWSHRAYWGENKFDRGIAGTASRRHMGPIPAAGAWVRLEVPATFVGVAGGTLSGLAFTLFGGGATWGAAGRRPPTWVEQLTHVPTFLARTGISYVELIDLLRTRYINPALPQGMTVDELATWAGTNLNALGKMIVLDAPDSACDLTLTRLQHVDGTLLDDDELGRLHRFIRLWRKTGWSVQDLDRAMVALQAPDITPAFLRQLGQILQLQKMLELSPQQLLSFWGSIPIAGDDALYRKLFLNKAVREIDPIFTAVNGEYLTAANLKISEHVPALLAGLRTRASDLALVREHAEWTVQGPPGTPLAKFSADDAPLRSATATVLYRYVSLARATKMAVKDLIALQVLSGTNPFSKLSNTNLEFELSDIDPARTLSFVRLAERVTQSGFTPASLSYLFNSLENAPPNFAPTDESIEIPLSAIREGLVRIARDNVPADDPTGDLTRAKLGLVFEPHVAEQIASLVAGTAIYSAPIAALPAGVSMPQGKVNYDKTSRLLQTSAWLTDAEQAALFALSRDDGYQKAVQSLYDQPRKDQPRKDLLLQTLAHGLAWKSAENDLRVSVLDATSFGTNGTVDPALVAGKFNAFLAGALPYFRTVLSRALVKQTLADALSLEPATAAFLLEGTDDVVPVVPLLGTDAHTAVPAIADFLALTGDGLTADYFANETLTDPHTSRVNATIDFRWDAKRGFGARWTGKVLADKTQTYQFHLRAGGGVRLTIDGKVIEQWKDAAPAEYTVACDMKTGEFYELKLEYFNRASVADSESPALLELRWSGPATPAEIIPSSQLYSTVRPDVDAAALHTYLRLHKASLLVNGLHLAVREIAQLANPRHPNALDLNTLPVKAVAADRPALFRAWSRWNDFTTLRARATNDPTTLVDVLHAESVPAALKTLGQATGWDAKALEALAGAQGFALQDADYRDATKLLALADAMRLLDKLGAPAIEVFTWAAFAPSMGESRAAAQEAKRAHKARYDADAWLEVARSVTDLLREAQRAALVAYLLPQLGYAAAGQLFEHFLIDVEMSPCMQTSRIKQAISSVQLFVQRCRMNLEMPNVSPTMIDGDRWKWMQNYRVWEANLKVFLYPENWIEPELRDDKSPFFKELESELLQAEVTADTAEAALGTYLEKLDTVSQLKICGMYEETEFAPDEKRQGVLHVFGHTFATPRTFYYRQLVTAKTNYRYWTPWERVPVEIEADEVLPVSWNRRLYVLWAIKGTKTRPKTIHVTTTDAAGGQTIEDATTVEAVSTVRLAWTEYRNGKWSSKRTTSMDFELSMNVNFLFREESMRLAVSASAKGGAKVAFVKYNDVLISSQPSSQISWGSTGFLVNFMIDGEIDFVNVSGLVAPTLGHGTHSIAIGQSPFSLPPTPAGLGYMPLLSTELEFVSSEQHFPGVSVLQRIPSADRVYLFKAKQWQSIVSDVQMYTLNDLFFFQEGERAYLVRPRSIIQPSVENDFVEGAPYLPTSSSFTPADLTASVQLVAGLSTARNSWLAGRASLLSAEARTISASEAASLVETGPTLSISSELFRHGVIQPSAILAPREPAAFQFETFFHPYAAEFLRRLTRYGVDGLLNLESQQPATQPKVASFKEAYVPNKDTVKESLWPKHDVDFAFSGAYSLYNWEMFFHVPLFIATRLSQNQRFEEAIRWFHYIFDPTAGSTPLDSVPQCYWNVLPLRETVPLRLDDMLKNLKAGDGDVIAQWEDVQAHPFQPHRVARLRRIAYQKTVVMKYIDNLIAWGDQLFRQDTIETINQATQLYVLAAALLGPRVQRLPPRGRNQSQTYAQLRLEGLDKFNQALVDFENDLPFSNRATTSESSTATTGLLGIGRSFYFCLPKNDKLLGYWDTVANRLFNIRHCMNIEGVVRELPLFEPPIDPALLVKAAAQGIDLSSVLNDLSAPLPYYRFSTLLARALEMTGELRVLGGALLAALEKRDAEHLSNLRASHEAELLSLVKQVKQQQLTEAQAAETALQKSRDVTQTRFDFYANIQQRIGEETNQLNELVQAQDYQMRSQSEEFTAAEITHFAPDISIGIGANISGTGPTFSATLGRANLIAGCQALSRAKSMEASIHSFHANRSSILGGWQRRSDDWTLQKNLATKELAQIDKQITAANIRVAIAQQELDNTTRQIEQSQEIQEFLRNKFTGEELYNWMVGDISTVFFQCYQMTYDLAKKAERCYRFELGLVSSNFIQFGAWDSMRRGLLSGERLYLQLKQMEQAHLDGNRREYELTKHYSLVLNDPSELINLKEQGSCEIELPEALFDIDFPGHYMRRVKSVSVSIPAVVGPYTGVNCTLTLLRDKTRVKNSPADDYAEREGEEDDRFLTSWTRMQAIATSSAQNDSGMFELNFRDERYLPFEGAGVMSRWRIELPRDFRQFDYNTIADVVLHIKYTAREGGVVLRDAAVQGLNQQLKAEEGKSQARLFSLRHEFPTEWQRLQSMADISGVHTQAFSLAKPRFPFVFQGGTITVNRIEIFGLPKDRTKTSPAPEWRVTPPAPAAAPLDLKDAAAVGSLVRKVADAEVEVKNLGDTKKEADWTIQVLEAHVPASLDRFEDILLLCHYAVQMAPSV